MVNNISCPFGCNWRTLCRSEELLDHFPLSYGTYFGFDGDLNKRVLRDRQNKKVSDFSRNIYI